MPPLSWIVVGLLVGVAGSRFMNRTGQSRPRDFVVNIVVGIAGAVVGGLMFNAAGRLIASAMNPWSLFVSAVGSAVVFWAWHALVREA